MNEGFRRLSLFFGILGVVCWTVTFLTLIVMRVSESEVTLEEWGFGLQIIGAGYLVCFFVPWGIVRGIAWVIEGFKSKN